MLLLRRRSRIARRGASLMRIGSRFRRFEPALRGHARHAAWFGFSRFEAGKAEMRCPILVPRINRPRSEDRGIASPDPVAKRKCIAGSQALVGVPYGPPAHGRRDVNVSSTMQA